MARGGGGGRGGVRGGGESRGNGFRMSSVGLLLLVSGRLCVRPVLLGWSVTDSVCTVAGSEVSASVKAGRSEIVALEITDEPPAADRENYRN